jgi:hypothetical protein
MAAWLPQEAPRQHRCLAGHLEAWLHHDNRVRPHQVKMCCGKTPFGTMIEGQKSGRKSSRSEFGLTDAAINTANCKIKSELLQMKSLACVFKL